MGRVSRMQMRDRTKAMFAEELENMLREMPLSKVRVGAALERYQRVEVLLQLPESRWREWHSMV